MTRFRHFGFARYMLLLINEFKLARTATLVHLIAMLNPTLLYLLMTAILVHPTWDMNVIQPTTSEGYALVAAMREVGSPIGLPYINPIIVSGEETDEMSQVVVVETRDGIPTAVQRYGLIDSNLVKNFRNRLTAASLHWWNAELGSRAVIVEQHPWLPRDVPYTVYFGMALLPTAVFVAASFIGSILVAQDFEFQTVAEYQLAPVSLPLILGARMTRLILSALLSAGVLLLAVGLATGTWPDSLWQVGLILLPVAVIAGSLGTIAGLLLRRSIPAFVIGLGASLGCWILGSGFGLAAGFGGLYERLSRLTPNTHAIELLFPHYYGIHIGRPLLSALVLVLYSAIMLTLTMLVYRWRVLQQE